MNMKDKIIYEQPLNEVIRVCLRLEQLFQQVDHQLHNTSTLGTRDIISFIINILQLVDRPDLKAKLAKELTHHLANLLRFGSMPDIDANKLNQLTSQLDELSRNLIDSSGKIGQPLRDIELLNTLRLHLASPGGACSFDIPVYHYWLQQPIEVRQAVIKEWMSEFSQIRTASVLVLDLVRSSARIEQKEAILGFHQELLDPQSNLRMIRIGIPHNISAYPEISVGRHFLSARFFAPDIEKRPGQYPENLSFSLAYCNC